MKQALIGLAITVVGAVLVWIGSQVVMAADLQKELEPLRSELVQQNARMGNVESNQLRLYRATISREIYELETAKDAGRNWTSRDEGRLRWLLRELELIDEAEP